MISLTFILPIADNLTPFTEFSPSSLSAGQLANLCRIEFLNNINALTSKNFSPNKLMKWLFAI